MKYSKMTRENVICQIYENSNSKNIPQKMQNQTTKKKNTNIDETKLHHTKTFQTEVI